MTYSGVTAVFSPAVDLSHNTLYTATITTGAEDLAGNALAASHVWTFTTGDAPDITAPMVIFNTPPDGGTGISTSANLAVVFSEAMNPLTVNAATFTVHYGTTPVPGTVTYIGTAAAFHPASGLASNTAYTAVIAAAVSDLAGNTLEADYVWTFTTGEVTDNTAPTVIFNTPPDGETGISIRANLAVIFSEAMDPLTVTTTTFTLHAGATPVPGAVRYIGTAAAFHPAVFLAPNTLYTAVISAAATDLSGNALAADYVWTFTTGEIPDTTAPLVSSTDPVDGATDVPVNKKIAATFSEAMDPLSITTATFKLSIGTTPVPGSVAYAGVTAVFTPASALANGTVYTATITAEAKDLSDNALAADYVWTFTTGEIQDNTAPTVTFTVPGNGTVGVLLGTNLSATFSEPMDPLSVMAGAFTVVHGTTPVLGSVSYTGVTAVFNPAASLTANTVYTATIGRTARDLAGNKLAADYTWTFTTGAAPDTTPPAVTSTDPANGAAGVPLGKKIAATFSEAMDPLTVTAATFTLKRGLVPTLGSVVYAGVTAIFTPIGGLAPNTTYTATVLMDAEDMAGNKLAGDYTWTFTTGAALDTIAPTVISTDPLDAAIGVPINKKIAATFSEAMDPLTVTTAAFVLDNGTTPVPGTVIYAGVTATFTPTGSLAPNTTYTATVLMEAADLAGNALAGDYVWTFTTGTAPDTVAPTVLLTDPLDLAIGVPGNKTITATFSEAMDSLTITTATFILEQGTTAVLGVVTYLGTTATFTPALGLAPNTTYTATVLMDAADLSGNTLTNDYVWSFTTSLLGSSDAFGAFGGGAGITNQGILTVVNGDIGTTGASTLITGFHDTGGNIYTETPLNAGTVNGTIFTAPPAPGTAYTFAIATQAAADAQNAYDNILSPAAMPGGTDPFAGQLGGKTVAPGVYMAAGGSFEITGLDLTLDGEGDPNAVWVFQASSTLTVGDTVPRSVILINGAQAKNVYWWVGSAATINGAGGGTMAGSIIAYSGVTFSTAGNVALTILNGRALGLNASVTLVNTVINVPAP